MPVYSISSLISTKRNEMSILDTFQLAKAFKLLVLFQRWTLLTLTSKTFIQRGEFKMMKQVIDDFLKKVANEEADGNPFGEISKMAMTPKVAEHIFANAKIAGGRAEAEHLAGCVKSLLEKVQQIEEAAKEREEELREKIKTLEKDSSDLEDKCRNIRQRLTEVGQSKKENADKVFSISHILINSDAADPADMINAIRKILNLGPPESSLGEKVTAIKKEAATNADISGASGK
jgi:DNA-binding transcriptional MerR regulator